MFKSVRTELHASLDAVREELDDHRDAINDQNRDVAEVRELLGAFDERIEKLAGRIDELYLLLGAETALSVPEDALMRFLSVPRTIEEVAVCLRTSLVGAERAVRVLELKGVRVSTSEREGRVVVSTREQENMNSNLSKFL